MGTFLRKENLVFFFMQFLLWASSCLCFSFLFTFLMGHGYSSLFCGMLTAAIALMSILAQPVIGVLTDRYLSEKKLVIITQTLAIPASFLPPLVFQNEVLTIISVLILATLCFPMYSLVDVWTTRLGEKYEHIDYGFTRSGGSLGFAITAILFGWLMTRLGNEIIYYANAGILVLFVICACFAEEIPAPHRLKLQQGYRKKSDFSKKLKKILLSKEYLVFIASCFCFHLAFKAVATYLPLCVEAVHADSTGLGAVLSLAAIAEMPALMITSRYLIKRYSPAALYLTAVGMGIIRSVGLLLAPNLAFVLLVQVLQAVYFSIYTVSFLRYIVQTVDKSVLATATSLGYALTSGLGMVLGSVLGGVIIEQFGLSGFHITCIILTALAGVIFLPIYLLLCKRNRHQAE